MPNPRPARFAPIAVFVAILVHVIATAALAQAPNPPPSPVPAVTAPAQPAAPAPDPVPTLTAPAVPAAGAPAAAAPPSPELERLLQTLENDAERQRLVEGLRALLQAQRSGQAAPAEATPQIDRVGGRFVETLAEQIGGVGAAVLRAAGFVADAPKLWHGLRSVLGNPVARARIVETVTTIAAILLVAWAAEWLTRLALVRPRRVFESRPGATGWRRLRDGIYHALLALVPIAVFGAAAFIVLGIAAPTFVVALIAVAMINASLLSRAIGLASWTILAPRVPRLRLLPLADETAAYFDLWIRRIAGVSIYGQFAAEAVYIVGLPYSGYVFLLKLLGVVVALMLVILVLQNRHTVAQIIAGSTAAGHGDDDPGAPRRAVRRFADYWHVPTLTFVAFVLAVWLLQQDSFVSVLQAAALTLVLIALAWLASRLARRLITRMFTISEELKQRFPTLEARANRYSQILDVAAIGAIWAFAVTAILEGWGLRSLEWLTSQSGRRITSSTISIALTVLVALAVWEGVRITLDRYVGRVAGASLEDQRRAARIRTMIPLINRVLLMILGAFVGLIVLSELGVNIAPLLALSGAVGIAVGLGAQQLIKDLIAGASMVIEDTVAIGDAVEVGDKAGVVEDMSLRALKLRALDGTLHTIPFGEFKIISNMSKDFSFAVVEVHVGYGADVDTVIDLIIKTAEALRQDPDVGPLIRSDFESFGAERFGAAAIIYRGRFRTLPGRAALVVRAFNRAIKNAFDRAGIEMPYPQHTIRMIAEPPRRLGPVEDEGGPAKAG
ncbi:MAG: mechanosensitive ion channel [Alphaproteobacteria bacterium]|nr:mechanosensitive ion channel [Alphaproteobacteria bacterium]